MRYAPLWQYICRSKLIIADLLGVKYGRDLRIMRELKRSLRTFLDTRLTQLVNLRTSPPPLCRIKVLLSKIITTLLNISEASSAPIFIISDHSIQALRFNIIN